MSSRTESFFASLAFKSLVQFAFTSLTIAHQGVKVLVFDAIILTILVEAGEAFSLNVLWAASFAFKFTPGSDAWPFASGFSLVWLCDKVGNRSHCVV
jgi:hypothetical protein